MKQFPQQSSARILTNKIPTTSAEATVNDTLKNIRSQAHTYESISYTYILSSAGKLLGVVAIKSLLKAKDKQRIREIMTPNPIAVHPYTDQEKAAILAIQHNIKAVPVVDKNHKFLGIIPTDKILEILHQEHIEDILQLSGLDISSLQKASSTQRLSSNLKSRLPWLFIGLSGGTLASWIVSSFQHTLQTNLSLAFFIPVIVYMSGAIASQTHSILIRNLLLIDLKMKSYILREVVLGAFLGIIFAVLLGIVTLFWIKSTVISTIIFITMFLNSTISSTISTTVPWLLFKLKKDPALAAGPFAIIVQDLLSLLVYFLVAHTLIS